MSFHDHNLFVYRDGIIAHRVGFNTHGRIVFAHDAANRPALTEEKYVTGWPIPGRLSSSRIWPDRVYPMSVLFLYPYVELFPGCGHRFEIHV